jgi:hypothetical protein
VGKCVARLGVSLAYKIRHSNDGKCRLVDSGLGAGVDPDSPKCRPPRISGYPISTSPVREIFLRP